MIELAGGMNYRFASASLQGASKKSLEYELLDLRFVFGFRRNRRCRTRRVCNRHGNLGIDRLPVGILRS